MIKRLSLLLNYNHGYKFIIFNNYKSRRSELSQTRRVSDDFKVRLFTVLVI